MFLMETLGMAYSEFMSVPYSRRQRLIEWKREALEKEKQQAEQRRK